MLKSKQTSAETVESRYGSAVPTSALQALQRDSSMAASEPLHHSVYHEPMAEVSLQPLLISPDLPIYMNYNSRFQDKKKKSTNY